MRILFRDTAEYLGEPADLINIMGKPLLLYNIEKIISCNNVESILLPEGFSREADTISENYPSMKVEEYKDRTFVPGSDDLLELPLRSIIVESKMGDLVVDQIVYPWDLLRIIGNVLESEIKTTLVSPNTVVSDSTIIRGACVIEDGVYIDDFCKIKGPAYIGKNSKIGTGSLLRNCMIGSESNIGFNCEIGRSYFVGKNKIAHHNVILDSIIGEGVWMGGYVGTTNVLLNNRNVKYKVGNELVDTGLDHFGAVIGSGSMIGAGVIILPGRYIRPNSVIQAGTVIAK